MTYLDNMESNDVCLLAWTQKVVARIMFLSNLVLNLCLIGKSFIFIKSICTLTITLAWIVDLLGPINGRGLRWRVIRTQRDWGGYRCEYFVQNIVLWCRIDVNVEV